jgi:hypothetical protein
MHVPEFVNDLAEAIFESVECAPGGGLGELAAIFSLTVDLFMD